jgi:quinoprotein relay system zinc metallohydrolase 2
VIARRPLLLFCCAAPLACAVSRAGFAADAPPFALTAIAPGVYFRRGVDLDASAQDDDAIANIGCIIGADAVAVIDPGGSARDGARLRAAIRALTDKPIRYVILSHVHPDHVFGAGAFLADNPVFVGHARLPAALAARGEFYRKGLADLLGAAAAGPVVVPSLLVADTHSLDLGGRVLDITAHEPAHTDCDLTLFDRQSGTLCATDLLFVGRIPSLDGSLRGWLRQLPLLQAQAAARVVPGHGPVSQPWPDAGADELRYLTTLARETRAVIARGGDIEEAIRSVGLGERGRWKLFDDYHARNVTEAYKELEWE